MTRPSGTAAGATAPPESAAEVERLRHRLRQAADALEQAARAVAAASLAVARALDTPGR